VAFEARGRPRCAGDGIRASGLRPRAWYALVPDQKHAVVAAGYGDFEAGGNAQDNTYATTARTADGTLVNDLHADGADYHL